MKAKIEDSLREIICNLYSKNISNINDISINLQENKEKAHGDLASNIAMVLAKPLGTVSYTHLTLPTNGCV